jgi:hypothetical protein
MNIGNVAKLSGLPIKTIRYYENIGFIRPQRSANGYRSFRDADVHKLAFLGRARSLGFTIRGQFLKYFYNMLWRRVPESNRCTRICNPLHNHSTNPPLVV